MSVEKIIHLLDSLEIIVRDNNLNPEDGTGWLSDTSESKQTPEFCRIMNEVQVISDTVLILPDGQADHHSHGILKKISNGKYRIMRGEYDSFGWLSGIIVTPFGKISYG